MYRARAEFKEEDYHEAFRVKRVKWFLEAIQNNFMQSYNNDIKKVDKKNHALDETLIPFCGWLPFIQYLPNTE